MKTKTLSPELLHKMDAYWRAANYLSVGQIYLYDNPLLKRPLTLADVKHMPSSMKNAFMPESSSDSSASWLQMKRGSYAEGAEEVEKAIEEAKKPLTT